MKKLLLLFLLVGCVTNNSSNNEFELSSVRKWKWIPPNNSILIHIHFLGSQEETTKLCEIMFRAENKIVTNAIACAKIKDGVCNVYIKENYDEYVMTHELLHCSGWEHENIDKFSTDSAKFVTG